MDKFIIKPGNGSPLGAVVLGNGVQFTVASKLNNLNLVLINSKGDKTSLSLGKPVVGNIYSLIVEDISFNDYCYYYESDGNIIEDEYARLVKGNEKFGVKSNDYSLEYAIVNNDFEWDNDSNPMLPYDEMILYLLHVRGFTKHKSSKVKNNGTFNGIIEKIPYLLDLGVNSIELMPAYEFEEFEFPTKKIQELNKITGDEFVGKINYWGYKNAYYYAPKSSYSSGNPVNEFKTLVKEMHKNSIEVIMQMYFPDSVKPNVIVDILKYWVINYHVDGFHLKGNKIPISFIANDSFFAKTKILHHYIPENEVYEYTEKPQYKNLCVYSDSYMYSMRKVLKGDEDCLKDLANNLKNTSDKTGTAKFITNYYGFTLNDLVSYDRKHNEDNGENNADGCDFNYSWNCGVEGKTKKASILSLRKKMIMNALFLVFTSKGMPVILSGDEFCNSQEGNNNPYCQDNEISYINWNNNAFSKEIYDFTKKLIKFRKDNLYPLINREFTMLDNQKIGYPDLSYHSDEAWKTDFANYNRHLGLMYSIIDKDTNQVELYYLAYNFYWKDITFSLPNLPNDVKWNELFHTGLVKIPDETKENDFEVEQRSCAVFHVKFDKKLKSR